MLVLAIDVGILNLGLVQSEIDDDYRVHSVRYLDLIDLTVVRHNLVSVRDCRLHHSNMLVDRIQHMVQENYALFDDSTYILIERQPIMGLTNVEQVLCLLFRDKVQLVSPNSMHKFFGISGYTYEGRKDQTEKLVAPVLDQIAPQSMVDRYTALERKHDVADALCLTLFWVEMEQRVHEKAKQARLKEKESVRLREEARDAAGGLDADTLSVFSALVGKYTYTAQQNRKK